MAALHRKIWSLALGLLFALSLAACSGGGGDGGDGAPPLTGCTLLVQKQSVLDIMEEWYFFNDEPSQQQKYAGIDLNDFFTPEDLLAFLRFQPESFDRNFSFITTPQADQQFFGEGQFIGFGFGSRFVDAPFNTDLRLTQIFSGSPADAAGFQRGFQILEINGRTIAQINLAEGLANSLGPLDIGVERTFRIRDLGGVESDVTLSKALVTIDPVGVTATFDVAGTTVGYLNMSTFVSTADAQLDQAFQDFEAQGVSALVVDVRYNGGGLLSTANLFADLIAGFIAEGEVSTELRFNGAKSAQNSITRFQQRVGSLTLLQQVVFIATGSSASASELLINSVRPHTVVTVVGATTFGKPVGQSGFGYCDDTLLLRPVTFEAVNSLGGGQFFSGIPADCAANDELTAPLGDPSEESLETALTVVETGACPAPGGLLKPVPGLKSTADFPLPPGAPAAQRLMHAF